MPNGREPPLYDIFVSYARVDDDPPPGVEHGWVSTCVSVVRKYLARELGRKELVRLWMDYELRGSDAVTTAIHQQLATTRVLLLFLSKGYLESRWCMEELTTFTRRVEAGGGCVFPVYVSPIDSIPAPLTNLLKYSFWKEDQQGRPRTLGDPAPNAGREPEYYHLARDLARDLAAKLAGIAASDATGATGPGTRIFVGGADQDLDLVRAAATALRERGLSCRLPITAIPDFDPATPRAEVRRDFEDGLANSDQLLLFYRDGPLMQLRKTISEVEKQRARDDRVPDHTDLCQPHPDPLATGLSSPDLNIIITGDDCADDCIGELAARLASSETGPETGPEAGLDNGLGKGLGNGPEAGS